MKNMLRRNLALLLAVVMILSCAPLDGMAAVIGASQLFDQFADQLATDYSGGASIPRRLWTLTFSRWTRRRLPPRR